MTLPMSRRSVVFRAAVMRCTAALLFLFHLFHINGQELPKTTITDQRFVCEAGRNLVEESVAYVTHHTDPFPKWSLGYVDKVEHATECQQQCTNVEECRSWTYRTRAKQCLLYTIDSAVANRVADADCCDSGPTCRLESPKIDNYLTRCEQACREAGYCCNDVYDGNGSGWLSCAQACVMRARMASENDCRFYMSYIDRNFGYCKWRIEGFHYDVCEDNQVCIASPDYPDQVANQNAGPPNQKPVENDPMRNTPTDNDRNNDSTPTTGYRDNDSVQDSDGNSDSVDDDRSNDGSGRPPARNGSKKGGRAHRNLQENLGHFIKINLPLGSIGADYELPRVWGRDAPASSSTTHMIEGLTSFRRKLLRSNEKKVRENLRKGSLSQKPNHSDWLSGFSASASSAYGSDKPSTFSDMKKRSLKVCDFNLEESYAGCKLQPSLLKVVTEPTTPKPLVEIATTSTLPPVVKEEFITTAVAQGGVDETGSVDFKPEQDGATTATISTSTTSSTTATTTTTMEGPPPEMMRVQSVEGDKSMRLSVRLDGLQVLSDLSRSAFQRELGSTNPSNYAASHLQTALVTSLINVLKTKTPKKEVVTGPPSSSLLLADRSGVGNQGLGTQEPSEEALTATISNVNFIRNFSFTRRQLADITRDLQQYNVFPDKDEITLVTYEVNSKQQNITEVSRALAKDTAELAEALYSEFEDIVRSNSILKLAVVTLPKVPHREEKTTTTAVPALLPVVTGGKLDSGLVNGSPVSSGKNLVTAPSGADDVLPSPHNEGNDEESGPEGKDIWTGNDANILVLIGVFAVVLILAVAGQVLLICRDRGVCYSLKQCCRSRLCCHSHSSGRQKHTTRGGNGIGGKAIGKKYHAKISIGGDVLDLDAHARSIKPALSPYFFYHQYLTRREERWKKAEQENAMFLSQHTLWSMDQLVDKLLKSSDTLNPAKKRATLETTVGRGREYIMDRSTCSPELTKKIDRLECDLEDWVCTRNYKWTHQVLLKVFRSNAGDVSTSSSKESASNKLKMFQNTKPLDDGSLSDDNSPVCRDGPLGTSRMSSLYSQSEDALNPFNLRKFLVDGSLKGLVAKNCGFLESVEEFINRIEASVELENLLGTSYWTKKHLPSYSCDFEGETKLEGISEDIFGWQDLLDCHYAILRGPKPTKKNQKLMSRLKRKCSTGWSNVLGSDDVDLDDIARDEIASVPAANLPAETEVAILCDQLAAWEKQVSFLNKSKYMTAVTLDTTLKNAMRWGIGLRSAYDGFGDLVDENMPRMIPHSGIPLTAETLKGLEANAGTRINQMIKQQNTIFLDALCYCRRRLCLKILELLEKDVPEERRWNAVLQDARLLNLQSNDAYRRVRTKYERWRKSVWFGQDAQKMVDGTTKDGASIMANAMKKINQNRSKTPNDVSNGNGNGSSDVSNATTAGGSAIGTAGTGSITTTGRNPSKRSSSLSNPEELHEQTTTNLATSNVWKPTVQSKSLLSVFQHMVNETWVSTTTRDRRDGKMPTGLQVMQVTKVQQPSHFAMYQRQRQRVFRELEKLQDPGIGARSVRLYNHFKQDGIKTYKAMPKWVIRRDSSAIFKNSSSANSAVRENLAGLIGLFTHEPIDPSMNEFYLWHGTSPHAAERITNTEFRLDKAGDNAGTLYGKGLYFAESSTKSDEYTEKFTEEQFKKTRKSKGQSKGLDADKIGCRPLILCRVLLGNVYYCGKDQLTEREIEAMKAKCSCEDDDPKKKIDWKDRYHSVLGDRERVKGTFREFIVYHEAQVYPEWIVWYKRRFD